MAESKPRVLLVEDTRSLAVVYEQYLAQDGYEVLRADCGQQALAQLLSSPPPVVLLDLELPDMSGMDILQQITEQQLPCSVVVITAHGSVDVAVEAMRLGAFDFLTKPFDGKRLCATARNALKHQQLSSLVAQYRENFERSSFAGFIGASMPMQAVYRIIESAAPSKATVFITGESGTGKEVCAEAIHQCNPRREQPFIALNCAAIPHDLMESEIFGHVKGSFTGAQGDRKGAASLADGGTLFLDEICEMDLDLQSKLLRFIQTGTLQRVGSGKLETVDVRFVCATNRDPLLEVKAGRFREDLYYRLHVIPLSLPPLRERGEDILLLARDPAAELCQGREQALQGFRCRGGAGAARLPLARQRARAAERGAQHSGAQRSRAGEPRHLAAPAQRQSCQPAGGAPRCNCDRQRCRGGDQCPDPPALAGRKRDHRAGHRQL